MKNFSYLFAFLALLMNSAYGDPYPIQFPIPECKIVDSIPQKDWGFAYIISGKNVNWI